MHTPRILFGLWVLLLSISVTLVACGFFDQKPVCPAKHPDCQNDDLYTPYPKAGGSGSALSDGGVVDATRD